MKLPWWVYLIVIGIILLIIGWGIYEKIRGDNLERNNSVFVSDIAKLRTDFDSLATDIRTGLEELKFGLVDSQGSISRIQTSINNRDNRERQFENSVGTALDRLGTAIARATSGADEADAAIARLEQYNRRVGIQLGFSAKELPNDTGQNGIGP
jgi:hypothetical protein